MLILLLVSIPISLLNVLNEIAVLILVSGAGFLSVLWLLIWGAKERPLDAPASSPADGLACMTNIRKRV